MDVTDIKGIGPKSKAKLDEANIKTTLDIVQTLPKRYNHLTLTKLSDVLSNETVWVEGIVTVKPKRFNIKGNLTRITFKVKIEDDEYSIAVFNQHYLMKVLSLNKAIVMQGKPDLNKKTMTAQTVRFKEHFIEGYHPVYGIDEITDQAFLGYVLEALPLVKSYLKEFIPDALLSKHKLIDYKTFIYHIHQPKDEHSMRHIMRRLKYQELFLYQLKVSYLKDIRGEKEGYPKHYNIAAIKPLITRLGYDLTEDQKTATNEIFKDIKSEKPMRRLLQGDTGSGKTIVAFLAMCAVMSAHEQAAFMAPTEILAKQHYTSLLELTKDTPFVIALLTGSTDKDERASIINRLKNKTIDAVVGTHVLFSRDVEFKKLGLVVTDEQHRFGVMQRRKLKDKGYLPDLLYLSATPIPRTLAMALFSDMDISTIKQKPVGRGDIKTKVVSFSDNNRVLKTIQNTVLDKQRVYVVVPVIDENDSGLLTLDDVKSMLLKAMPSLKTGVLHGKLKQEVKDTVLEHFKKGLIEVLISTTVIEVGIDIKEATLMVIYHADRFGLAQLHQLRGRVGRGKDLSKCLLVSDKEGSIDRLKVLEQTNDGFELSEYDLANRGFGDFIGTVQSGHDVLNILTSPEDLKILTLAKEDAICTLMHYKQSPSERDKYLIKKVKSSLVF